MWHRASYVMFCVAVGQTIENMELGIWPPWCYPAWGTGTSRLPGKGVATRATLLVNGGTSSERLLWTPSAAGDRIRRCHRGDTGSGIHLPDGPGNTWAQRALSRNRGWGSRVPGPAVVGLKFIVTIPEERWILSPVIGNASLPGSRGW